MIEFSISKCKTKVAFSVKPKKKVSLNLAKIRGFEIISKTPIVCVANTDEGEIIIHKHGELLFKTANNEEKIKEISAKIYSLTQQCT